MIMEIFTGEVAGNAIQRSSEPGALWTAWVEMAGVLAVRAEQLELESHLHAFPVADGINRPNLEKDVRSLYQFV